MLHPGVGQGLHVHGRVGGRASGDGRAHRDQLPGQPFDHGHRVEDLGEELPLLVGQGIVLLGDQNPLPYRNGGVGDGADQVGALLQDVGIVLKGHAAHHREDHAVRVSQLMADGLADLGHLPRLDGQNHQVGGRSHLGAGVHGTHPQMGRPLHQTVVVGCAGHNPAAGQHACVDQALGHGLGHVAVSDESESQ